MYGRGVCVAGRQAWQGRHAWQGVCMTGGMCGRWVCGRGGMLGRGACMAGGVHGMHAPPADTITYGDMVNERAVHILLECILVCYKFVIFFQLS